ncbi:MAG: peptidylprolyl isomerase, partial [Planctomycetota bacterium]
FRVESGGQSGLSEYIKKENLDEDEFYRVLRLSIAQEIMARKDFEVDPAEQIAVEKLNIWMKEQRSRANVVTEGLGPRTMVAINCREISRAQFGKKLCQMISKPKVSTLLTEMIGIQLISVQAREMGIALTEEDIRHELQERDARLKAEPGFESVTYESYLKAAQGQGIDDLVNSDKFRGELLLKKICTALHHEAYLQDFFESNREYFNEQYGEAARLSTIFFKAVKFPNEFVMREFDDAMEELKAIKDRLERGEVSFENMARIYSELDSKKNGCDLGFVSIGTPGWEEVVRAALMAEIGTLLGPFKTESGCHLVKVCGKRDNPSYEKIRDKVVREARQRYYQNLQKEAKIRRKY